MINDPKTYTATVAEENDNLILVFDPQMMIDLNWNDGDNIEWEIRDNSVIVKKVAGDIK